VLKCLVCGSDETEWLETVLGYNDEGYEEYACEICKGRSEYGIKIVKIEYTGKNDVIPYEIE